MFPNRFFLFFFNDTATTEIYTLSLHDALPISCRRLVRHLHHAISPRIHSAATPTPTPRPRSVARPTGPPAKAGAAKPLRRGTRSYPGPAAAKLTRRPPVTQQPADQVRQLALRVGRAAPDLARLDLPLPDPPLAGVSCSVSEPSEAALASSALAAPA